jgi:hypothetical protein
MHWHVCIRFFVKREIFFCKSWLPLAQAFKILDQPALHHRVHASPSLLRATPPGGLSSSLLLPSAPAGGAYFAVIIVIHRSEWFALHLRYCLPHHCHCLTHQPVVLSSPSIESSTLMSSAYFNYPSLAVVYNECLN